VRPTLPTFAQIRALPCLLEREATAEYQDANGHISATGQMAMHEEAARPFLATVDIPHGEGATSGIMDLDYHLRFFAEVMAGDTFGIHGLTLARAERHFHALRFLVDVTNERIADTLELVSVFVDLEARQAAPFPRKTAAAIDHLIATNDALDWSAPVCGAMGL
jgi:acyl-CoA thioester hydrolase